MIQIALDPRGPEVKCPILIKLRVQKRKGNATVPKDLPPDPDPPEEDPLISDLIDTEEDSSYSLGPDEIGFYTFFIKGEGNPPDLMGIEGKQLLAIQNDLQ